MNAKYSLKGFLFISFLPVIILAAFFPERILQMSRNIEINYSAEGADIVAFVQKDCRHCQQFKRYVLKQGWAVEYYEINSQEGRNYFEKLVQLDLGISWATPTIIINGQVFQGYRSDEETGSSLKAAVENCQKNAAGCLSFKDFLARGTAQDIKPSNERAFCPLDSGPEQCNAAASEYVVNVWWIGSVDLTELSLPILSILLGFLDGFNPCAMWVLVSLLTLLFALNDMRKMLITGFTFLFVSGVMYFVFIAAWLNFFLLIGYNFWIQKIIGIIAVGAGGFYFYEAFCKDPNVCKVTNLKQRHNILERMKKVVQYSTWPLMLGGVTILAISVNMIELVCTAGLPAIFTQILASNAVGNVEQYLYLCLYILFYMIDDLVIFLLALFTMKVAGLTTKYRRMTFILGGIMMYFLGILMIFFSELLIFK